jgi:hypothetical protein
MIPANEEQKLSKRAIKVNYQSELSKRMKQGTILFFQYYYDAR